MYLESAGDIYLDDVALVAGNQPDVGPNLIANGDFESTLSGTWSLAANMAGFLHQHQPVTGGAYSLHMVASSGASSGSSISPDHHPGAEPRRVLRRQFLVPGKRGWRSLGGSPVWFRHPGRGRSDLPVGAAASATPAAVNSVAGSRDPYPPVWLNEVQVDQFTGPTNCGRRPHALAGTVQRRTRPPNPWTGTTSPWTPTTCWTRPSPAGAVLTAGEYRIVFGDGRTDLHSPANGTRH